MAHFLKLAVFNCLVAGLTIAAFATAVITPSQVHAADVNLQN